MEKCILGTQFGMVRQNGTLALAKRMEQTVAFVGELRTGCSEKEPERFRVG